MNVYQFFRNTRLSHFYRIFKDFSYQEFKSDCLNHNIADVIQNFYALCREYDFLKFCSERELKSKDEEISQLHKKIEELHKDIEQYKFIVDSAEENRKRWKALFYMEKEKYDNIANCIIKCHEELNDNDVTMSEGTAKIIHICNK